MNVKVRATQPLTHKGQKHNTGDIFELLVEEAEKLIEQGLAELVKPKDGDPKK